MTLTANGKNYIANTFGVAGCFTATGISWTSVTTRSESIPESGGTAQIVNRLISPITSSVMFGGRSYVYNDVKSANDNQDLSADDVRWIAGNDGSPAEEPRYCISQSTPPPPTPRPITPTPTPRPTIPPGPTPQPTPQTEPSDTGGAAGQYQFEQPPSGAPSISLDLQELTMQQNSSDYHFEMNDVLITNISQWKVYLAMEVRLFTGLLSSCPQSGEVFKGMNRVSTSRAVRIVSLDPGATARYNLDFYQPLDISGLHTVCLLIHGTFYRNELISEISGIAG